MTRAQKLARATEALAILVGRLPGSLDISVFRYDMLMRNIVLLATNMRDATMEDTSAKRSDATAAAFRRAQHILQNSHDTGASLHDADYRRAAREAGMYAIPDEVYLKALSEKSATTRTRKARRPRGK